MAGAAAVSGRGLGDEPPGPSPLSPHGLSPPPQLGWETSRRQRRGAKNGIWRHLFQHLPTDPDPAGVGGGLGASPLLLPVWVVMWCCAHLCWHPASLLVPRAVGASARSPFVGRFHPSSTRSPFLSVSGAPGCAEEPTPAGAPQNTPLTPSSGENPAWEEQGERGDACHGWEVCHQPRAYRSPGESRNLCHSSRRSRRAPGEVSGCGWLLFSP